MAVLPPKKEDSQWSRLRRRRNTASVSLVADLRKAGYKRYLLFSLCCQQLLEILVDLSEKCRIFTVSPPKFDQIVTSKIV